MAVVQKLLEGNGVGLKCRSGHTGASLSLSTGDATTVPVHTIRRSTLQRVYSRRERRAGEIFAYSRRHRAQVFAEFTAEGLPNDAVARLALIILVHSRSPLANEALHSDIQ